MFWNSCGCPPPEPECKETELERLVMKCRQDLAPLKENMDTYTDGMKKSVFSAYGAVKGVLITSHNPDQRSMML